MMARWPIRVRVTVDHEMVTAAPQRLVVRTSWLTSKGENLCQGDE